MQAGINFFSAWYCPFAQRTWAALEYLELSYVYKETDPYVKSSQWLEVSRGTGQVPVLQIRSRDGIATRIPDSLRTLEYLDDLHGAGSTLFPAGAAERAEARFWLDYQGKVVIPNFYRVLKAENGSTAADDASKQMVAGIKAFTRAMSDMYPYFFGEQMGVVDIAFAPFALRIEILLSHYKRFQLPHSGEDWTRYEAWWRAMKSHPSFVRTMPQQNTYEERLQEFYLPYSLGGGQEDVTEAA